MTGPPTLWQHPHGSLPPPPWLESHWQPRGTVPHSSPINAGDIQSPQLNAKFTLFFFNCYYTESFSAFLQLPLPADRCSLQRSSKCPSLWAGDGRGQQGTRTIPLCTAAHPAPCGNLPIKKAVPRFAKAHQLVTQLLPDCTCISRRRRLQKCRSNVLWPKLSEAWGERGGMS